MKNYFQSLKNNFDFFIRQKFSFSRKNYFEKNEPKIDLPEQEKVLFEKYDLEYLKSNSTRQNYLENLYIIEVLEQYLPIDYSHNLKVLDVGCKNWFYVKGEYAFFKKHCENLVLDGIELDCNRLYSNFYSRAEAAKFHINNLPEVNYICGDFLGVNVGVDGKYDYIVWILPFVFKEPLLKWGLPLNFFQPEQMLLHAKNSLKEGGKIFIVNQGEVEYKAQTELCDKLNIQYKSLGKINNSYLNYVPRYAILIY